jgi:hypothetical protein
MYLQCSVAVSLFPRVKTTNLQKRLQTTIALLVDEISMLSQAIVALIEEAIAKPAHECGHAR